MGQGYYPGFGLPRIGERNLRAIQWALIAVLVIGGVYFVAFHKDLPLNHEAVMLGELHILHDVVGVVLLGLAGAVWWRARSSSKAAPPAS